MRPPTLDRIGPISLLRETHEGSGTWVGLDDRDGTPAQVIVDPSGALASHIVAAQRLWSTVGHPAFARLLGASGGGAGEPAWFATEQLEGQTLYELRAAGPAHPREAVELARQLCSAAGALHARGHLLHVGGGDLHVEVQDGRPRLRIALTLFPRVLGDTPGVIGKAQLEAPEVLTRGGVPDSRADVWRVGALLYLMLTTDLPFGGDTMLEACRNTTTRKPDPFRVELGVPRALQQVVWRALEKKPDDRYPSAGAFEAALAGLEL